MKITDIRVENFRGLSSIAFKPVPGLNVLAGPNAVGKTSLLEAIRLFKAFLFSRYQEEIRQVLISLGAASPNVPWGPLQIDISNLAGNEKQPVIIHIEITLDSSELASLNLRSADLGLSLIRNQMGQNQDATQLNFVQFLSSPQGKQQLEAATKTVSEYLKTIQSTGRLSSTLAIDPRNNSIFGSDQLAQLVISGLEGFSPPGHALFSYFPADRAMPSGEVNIQIGSGDMKAQAESHLGNAPSKYQRLKQSIVNQLVLQGFSAAPVQAEINSIIGQLLPGKVLEGIRQKPTGNLTVLIREKSGRVFDIDSMSSGEKGVLLTYFLLRTSMARGGIVLLDEPELHLNPTVCTRIVPYLAEDVLPAMDLQAFVCTHSPEVIGGAFERDSCALFHLRSDNDISRVYRTDQHEALEILRRLGVTTADVLSSKGSLFVEGDQDTRLVDARYFECLSGFKVTALGGREEIHKEIVALQEAESRGQVRKLSVFVFDRDNRPSTLTSTRLVKVAQLERYCIENYLLDEKCLFELLLKHAKSPPESRGKFNSEIRELAFNQLEELASRLSYSEPENCGIRPKEIRGKTIKEIASVLSTRLNRVATATRNVDYKNWENDFVAAAENELTTLKQTWHSDWPSQCDGKRLFRDLQARYEVKISPALFKENVMEELARNKSETWRLLDSIIQTSVQ